MNRGVSRFIPILFITVIVILVIAAIFSVLGMMFGSDKAPEIVDTSRTELLSKEASRSVRMTLRGPIVADENFRSYRVTVSPSDRTFVRHKGYLQNPLIEKAYTNNARAYEEFVFALDKAGMTNGTQLTGEADDTRGVCAGGVVYEFDILKGDKVVKHLWTTSCGRNTGSLKGNVSGLQDLFLTQVPNAANYIGKD